MNQGFLSPSAMLSLGGVAELRGIEVVDGELRLGATVTHREVERDARVREGWPVLAHAFGVVASPRVRNQATVGGVLADADYASDPPAVLQALGARAVLRSPRGERAVVGRGADPRLLRDVHRARRAAGRGPRPGRARARGVPEVPLALERGPAVRRRRGGVRRRRAARRRRRGRRDAAALPRRVRARRRARARSRRWPTEIGRRYAERIEPIGDARGSAAYRRRVTAVEVRRAIEALA